MCLLNGGKLVSGCKNIKVSHFLDSITKLGEVLSEFLSNFSRCTDEFNNVTREESDIRNEESIVW